MSEPFISRLERFGSIASTQPVVRAWLDDGTEEVAVATADEQTAGRGRQGRGWTAPAGAALLVSAGFRPEALELRHAWRLAATAALAMLDAAEDVAGLKDGMLRLKWPNDIVAEGPEESTLAGALLKLAGVLGESAADPGGAHVATAVIGIGINVGWRRPDFPAPLRDGMTSLHDLSGGRPIERDALLEAWLDRLEPRYEALRGGHFDAGAWSARQITTGRSVELELPQQHVAGEATGVDPESGALFLVTVGGALLSVSSGDVVRCRLRPRGPAVPHSDSGADVHRGGGAL